ncbi:MAG: polysaccharide biosynthesis C-terminal domain-containing protein [Bacteroidetes bacterium]|nr:polysaccharide biosynthesis C-terminal domain-containing protein [Bacteroidota bacterium]
MAISKIINNYRSGVKEDSYKGKYLKNLSSSFVLNIVAIVLTYLTTLLLTNITTKAEYGAYVAVNALANILAIFAPLGLNVLILRQLPEYKTKQKFGLIKGINRFSMISIFVFSAVITLVAILICSHYNVIKGIHDNTYIIIGLSCVPLLSMLCYFQGVLNGLKHIGKSLLGEKILRPLLIIGGGIGLYLFVSNPTGLDLLKIFLVASFLVFILAFFLMQRGLRQEIPNHKAEYERSFWLKQGLLFVPLSALSVINSNIDIQMIGLLMNEQEALNNIALFNVANKGAQALSIGLIISNYVLGPSASELYHTGQKDRLQNIVTQTARMVMLVSLPLFLILIIGGFWFLGWFGDGYQSAYPTMLILIAGQFINVAAGSVGYLLIMTKNEKYSIIGMAVSVLVNILLNLLLIKDYGIIGVAIATAISLALWNLIMLYFLVKKTGLNPTAFALNGKK